MLNKPKIRHINRTVEDSRRKVIVVLDIDDVTLEGIEERFKTALTEDGRLILPKIFTDRGEVAWFSVDCMTGIELGFTSDIGRYELFCPGDVCFVEEAYEMLRRVWEEDYTKLRS